MQNNFNGGIISPEMYGRFDQAKYQSGVADASNMLVLPHGALDYRTGFEFVTEMQRPFRLIPFTYSDEQAIIIILCPPVAYFSTLGKVLLNDDGTLLRVAIPYSADELRGIRYAQSGDIITMTHKNHAPRLLKRISATSWTLSSVSATPSISVPAGVEVTASTTNDSGIHMTKYSYVVTAIKGNEESAKSSVVTVENDLTVKPNFNTVKWDAVAGAERYRVYKKQSGVFGKIAETTDLQVEDNYIEADTFITPSVNRKLYDVTTKDYPVAVGYMQQRKVYAGGSKSPQVLNFSRSGTEDVFTYSVPGQDDDAISIRIAGRDGNGIQHLVPMNDLLILTSASAWKVSAATAITPEDLMVYPQANTGSNECTPLLTDNVCIFSSDQTGRIHELSLSANRTGAYQAIELSLFCPQLFDGYKIVDQAITRNPFTCAFFVRDDGKMIGLTYDPLQQVFGFHKHDTDGLIETVAVIPEEGQSSLYLGINRQGQRFVERFRMRRKFNKIYENHLDCSIVKEFSQPTKQITGLDWLNGKRVSVLADGTLEAEDYLVENGTVNIENESKVFIVGLPYEGYFTTLPLYQAYANFNPLKPKTLAAAYLRVYNSASVFLGQYYLSASQRFLDKQFVGKQVESKARLDEPYNTAPDLYTGLIKIPTFGTAEKDIQAKISQKKPLPLTVQAIHLEFN